MSRFNSKIKRIHRASERTIGKFSATEAKLAKQNAKFDVEIDKLDDEIAYLFDLRRHAANSRTENRGIISRIGVLIRGESAE